MKFSKIVASAAEICIRNQTWKCKTKKGHKEKTTCGIAWKC